MFSINGAGHAKSFLSLSVTLVTVEKCDQCERERASFARPAEKTASGRGREGAGVRSIRVSGSDEAAASAMVFADASHLCFDRLLNLNHNTGLAPYLICYCKTCAG
jgi:hypothetical protein